MGKVWKRKKKEKAEKTNINLPNVECCLSRHNLMCDWTQCFKIEFWIILLWKITCISCMRSSWYCACYVCFHILISFFGDLWIKKKKKVCIEILKLIKCELQKIPKKLLRNWKSAYEYFESGTECNVIRNDSELSLG